MLEGDGERGAATAGATQNAAQWEEKGPSSPQFFACFPVLHSGKISLPSAAR